MSKVPSPRLPKRLRRTVVFCAALAAVFSLISAAIHSMTLLRINSVLSQAQRAFPKLEEAAELDGASKWQIFWNVTLPQLKPTTFFVIIMLTIASFKVYDQMYMITQGGPGNATMTLVYYIYNVAFVNTPKYGYASAVSMVLFVLVLFVTIIQFKGSSSND